MKEKYHLSPVEQRFILHWGEMGSQWGINRTVAQIHALLYITPKPLDAEAISSILNVARSNVSTSLKELQSWGILRRVNQLGDKRDYFESVQDVWELFRLITNERKKREIDPTLSILRSCIVEANQDDQTSPQTEERLRNLAEFLEVTTSWYDTVSKWPTKSIRRMLTMGDKIRRRVGL
ncbi:MAG: MarR family transcriptional regulator [Opitutales bacterium]|nr:MarR family transcriptional regulator [Opitutales bacterium]